MSEVIVSQNPSELLALAVKENLDLDKLERLMELQERWTAQQAKGAYYDAMSRFQAAVPELTKSETVSFGGTHGRTYSYASLGVIAAQIKDALQQCGLSYRWEFNQAEQITVSCIITHKDGHSEQTTMMAPADDSGSKNEVQQRGSTLTYLERYTLIGALGLATADSDTDGRSVKPEYDNDLPPNQQPPKTGPGTKQWDLLAGQIAEAETQVPPERAESVKVMWMEENGLTHKVDATIKQLEALHKTMSDELPF